MKAIIEMPKGDDRRRHFKFDKTGFIDLGPIKEIIPVNNGLMPIGYGYIPGTLNIDEGDEIDVLILSNKILEVAQEVEVEPIALIVRDDGDNKVVAVDDSISDIKEWKDITEKERWLIEQFFSYHHKILAIENLEVTKQYIENGYKQFVV
jgi:inorganic pyrophosphatase